MSDKISLDYLKEYPQYKQLCEDLKADPRFKITAEEASKRMAEALLIERESFKYLGISVRLLTLHDNWKYWESLGMDRKVFEGTSIYAWSNLNKAQNRFKKAFFVEIILPFSRWSKKIIKRLKGMFNER